MLQAQTINFIPTVGSPTAYAVANIKKITFSDGNLSVFNTGTTSTFALSGNNKIFFTATTLSIAKTALEKNSFYCYLNPILAVLTISNTDDSAMITDYHIIALDGRVLKTKHHINKNEEQIMVADLPSGIYFCDKCIFRPWKRPTYYSGYSLLKVSSTNYTNLYKLAACF